MNIQLIQHIYNIYKTLYENGKIEKHEMLPDSKSAMDKDISLYLFMTTAFNFQRSSLLCWKSAYKTYMDKDTNCVFYPHKTYSMAYQMLYDKLTKHKLIQMKKHIPVWIQLQNTLYTYYQSDVRELYNTYNYDIEVLIQHYKNNKKDYPHLGGNKLGAYSFMIQMCYLDYPWKNRHTIGIVPDTHIIKASHLLDVSHSDNPIDIDKAWRPILKEYNLNPIYMHSALWRCIEMSL